MRRYLLKQLISRTEAVRHVLNQLPSAVFLHSENKYVDLMTQLQEEMIAIGTAVEEAEGEGTTTVKLIEDICEKFYEFTESDETEKRYKISMDMGMLGKSIYDNLCEIKEDHFIAVFLPYKISMWDAMESVWQAADRDPDCDAYVVPIPYIVKNEGSAETEVLYEGNRYPEYVPVTDYREFDLEKVHPDVIFIHYPYDNCNHITGMLPQYCSSSLKWLTENLTYIPYYVTGGSLGAMHKLLPAYIYSDNIIMQNKQQVEMVDPLIADKVRPLGSPKFDKVINMTVTEEMVPDMWKNKMRDVKLFVNTGINGVLENNENSLHKIRHIFQTAKEMNATVIWRPHPLLESTIRTMRPQLCDLYEETVRESQEYDNVILDTTESPELAIKICDAYVGEATSSIAHMFGVLGKPLFFVRQNVLFPKCYENVKLCCCTYLDGSIWAVASDRNALLRITFDGTIEEIVRIPKERDASNLYSDVVAYDHSLCLVPRNAKHICIYDVNNRTFTQHSITDDNQSDKINKAYIYNNKIYMVPRLSDSMVIYDITNNELGFNHEVVKRMKGKTGIPDIFCAFNASMMHNGRIYMAAPNIPYVLEYDLDRETYTDHVIEGGHKGFCCMDVIGDSLVLGGLGACELAIMSLESGKAQIIDSFPAGWRTDEEISFWDIIGINNEAYIFPRTNDMILKYIPESGELIEADTDCLPSLSNRNPEEFNHPDHFLFVNRINGKTVLQDSNRHGISVLDENGHFNWNPVRIDEKVGVKMMAQWFQRQGKNLPWAVWETKQNSIGMLITYIRAKAHDFELQKTRFAEIADNLDGTSGEKIYYFTKNN